MKNKFYTGIGSQETPPEILDLMTALGRFHSSRGFILRSGGADGADDAFEKGADPDLSEIYVPWYNFNGRRNGILSLPEAFVIAARYHPFWHKLRTGARALHARNVHQVLGRDLETPTNYIICWTSDGKASGGTGQAMRIAEDYGIPIYNLYYESIRDLFTRRLND